MPFFCIHISQGSVATRLKRGGIFKHEFVANLLPSRLVKKSENRMIVSEVMDKSLVSCFFWLTVYICNEMSSSQSPNVVVFTARCYASAVLAMALCLSVRPSVRLSVTSRCSTKTAKRRITQTTPHDSLGTLVFCSQRSPRNSTGVTPCGGAECRWGGSKSATFDK